MTDKLDLSLPQRPSSSTPKTPLALFIMNLIILAVLCVTLAVVLFSFRQKLPGSKGPALSNESLKKLALKLEDQGLNDVAAAAWKDYLSESRPGNEEAARIWFRIGKLYQDSQKYDQALAGYYRSEQFATIKDLSADIARRVQECLESAGKFAALRDELADRVGLQENNSGKKKTPGRETVVAEIGPQKITLSDLDHEIEKNIDQQIERIAPYLQKDVRNQQKEKMLKQYSTESQRQQFLSQYIAKELLYREARASNLAKDPEIQNEIQDQERSLLADKELQKTLADNIKITDGDLKTYYEAHQKDYQESFDEVKNEVYSSLYSQKQQEVQKSFFDHLKDKYDVVIHTSVLAPPGSEKENKDNTTTRSSKQK